jgi:hypothetical protein
MTLDWQWASAVVAISSGDKYYDAVRTMGANEVYRAGDCVCLVNARGRELLGIVTALWEASDTEKMVEVRQLYPELALARQLQSAPANMFPTTGGFTDAARVR